MTAFDSYFARIRPTIIAAVETLPEEFQKHTLELIEAVALCAWNESRDDRGTSGTEYRPDGAGCVEPVHHSDKGEQMEDLLG